MINLATQQRLTSPCLAREGMQTLAVGDVEAALERLREEAQPFELVVLDVRLVELHKWRTKQAKRVSAICLFLPS